MCVQSPLFKTRSSELLFNRSSLLGTSPAGKLLLCFICGKDVSAQNYALSSTPA